MSRVVRSAAGPQGGYLLAIDTATATSTLALGDRGGRLHSLRAWRPGHRPAETVLDQLGGLLAEALVEPSALTGFVVGIGPGAFTGLRVGLATAKTLAHELGRPIVGIATTAALALAAWRAATTAPSPQEPFPPAFTILLPAGPGARYVASYGVRADPSHQAAVSRLDAPRLLRPEEAAIEGGPTVVAVDLADPPSAASAALGAAALAGLAEALLCLGAQRLAAADLDDVAALVPTYVSLPRGAPVEGEAWSPTLR